jgi:hypothetical protein
MLIVAIIPDLLVYLKSQKSGKTDLSAAMDIIPMGQMMKKFMEKSKMFLKKK